MSYFDEWGRRSWKNKYEILVSITSTAKVSLVLLLVLMTLFLEDRLRLTTPEGQEPGAFD